jgi:exopolyphosphatase/pppGpp-phosphohydrolase
MKKIMVLLLAVLLALAAVAQAPRGSKSVMYVEFGGKGIKFGVIAFTDKSYRKYVPVESRELNVGLAKSIQSTGKISAGDIKSAASSTYDTYIQLLEKYKSTLQDKDVFFYTSSGVGVASNVDELCKAVKEKTNHNVYVVKETEEAKYTIAGTIPYDKIDNAMVLDQGGSNTKGGYVIKDGDILTAIPTNFDLGSVRVADLIVSNYMRSQPEEQDEYKNEFVHAMNECFDSLRMVIKNTFSNIDGSESRNELYLSGGAAFAVTTLLYPTAPLDEQMISVSYDKLKGFLVDIQNRDYFKELKERTFDNPDQQKSYKNACNIYNQVQLISATKLLLTYINALGGDDKKIYFNRFGLHSMPTMLIGRVLRGEISRW